MADPGRGTRGRGHHLMSLLGAAQRRPVPDVQGNRDEAPGVPATTCSLPPSGQPAGFQPIQVASQPSVAPEEPLRPVLSRGRGLSLLRASQSSVATGPVVPGNVSGEVVPGSLPASPQPAETTPGTQPAAPRPVGRAALSAKLSAMAIAPKIEPVVAGNREVQGPAPTQAVPATQLPVVTVEKYSAPVLDHKEVAPVVRMGESGKRVETVANYLKVDVDPQMGIYDYEVRFEPTVDSKDIRFNLVNQHREVFGPAKTFDGVTLYLPSQLPQNVTLLKSTHPVTGEEIMVKVILRQKKRAVECLHFYNVLLRKIARILGMVQMNRNYFNPNSPIMLNEEKLEVWPGYVQSVNVFEGGMMLCCDVSFRVLRTTTVLHELAEIAKNKMRDFRQHSQEVLVGLTVLTRYNNKSYRIDDILFDKNPENTFECKGKMVSYIDYYRDHYGIVIKDRKQPLLLNRLKKKQQGQEDETILVCLVPELCFLSGLDDRLRKNFTTMRALANHTRIAPKERELALRKYVESVSANEEAKRVLSVWGLKLSPTALVIPARILDSERLTLRNSTFITNMQCDWGKNLMNDILNPVKLDNWVLAVLERDAAKCMEFVTSFIDVGKRMGMVINSPTVIRLNNDRTDTYVNRIREEIGPKLQLAMAIFPTPRDDRYSAVKTLCCAQAALPSQMINFKTISNPGKLRSVAQKIAMQVNCKLGGELWAVHIPMKTMMVCGVDVYHDPTRRGMSVVGFVASVNSTITRWYSRCKYQAPGQEVIDTLKVCFMECLRKYYEVNHAYPGHIVMFRDGVSDGQLQFVKEYEVAQLISAFRLVEPPFEPKFTMVVVQKRINARFFLKQGEFLSNPPPGTVVDHTVTKRDWWDFFLVSQHTTQGTVSPTHYIVVHDGGMKPDHLQKLSYKMTHMYYNWPGTVSVPAPCQYAHKLAYLVGQNIRKEVKDELCDRLFFL